MKRQTLGHVLGKLLHQLPEVVTLAYDLRSTHKIPHWKDLSEDYNFGEIIIEPLNHVAPRFPKKIRLGPQNSVGSSRPEKLLKIVNCDTIKETKKLKETMVGVQVELMGGHQYPPGTLSLTHKGMYRIIYMYKFQKRNKSSLGVFIFGV